MCTGRFGNGGGSGMCTGGFCGFGGAVFGAWSIGTITTSGSNEGFYCGGFLVFAWSVALVLVGFCFVGGFGAGSPLPAMSDLV